MDYRPYNFPDLKRCSPTSLNNDQDSCSLFQPVFPKTSMNGTIQGPVGKTDEISQSIEQTRKKGYASGFAQGEKEGIHIAHAALSPGLESFCRAYENMTALIPQIVETTGRQVVKLVHDLSQRILGNGVHLSQQKLKLLESKLVAKMSNVYHLKIHFHPDDFNAIKELATVLDINYPHGCDEVNFVSDFEQGRGQVSLEVSNDPILGDVEELADTLVELSKHSSE